MLTTISALFNSIDLVYSIFFLRRWQAYSSAIIVEQFCNFFSYWLVPKIVYVCILPGGAERIMSTHAIAVLDFLCFSAYIAWNKSSCFSTSQVFPVPCLSKYWRHPRWKTLSSLRAALLLEERTCRTAVWCTAAARWEITCVFALKLRCRVTQTCMRELSLCHIAAS